MLKRSKFVILAVAAMAVANAANAQGSGLDTRLREAGARLDRDSQSCTPIDLGDYTRLLHEAGQNKIRADKAAKKGLPINQAQTDADLTAASALFSRAQAAMVQQCIRGAQQTAQPRATTGALPGARAAAEGGTCPVPVREAAAEDGHHIRSKDQIERTGNDMVEAYEKGRHSEAEYLRGSLDEEAAQLRKLIEDARPLGKMANFDVEEAERRLKQIDDYRKYADKIGIRPCAPLPSPFREATPQSQPMSAKTDDVSTRVEQPVLRPQEVFNPQAPASYEGDRTSYRTFHVPDEKWIKFQIEDARYNLMRDVSKRNYDAFQSLDYFHEKLAKYIEDAKEVGEFGEDVSRARKLLKEIVGFYNDKQIKLWKRVVEAQFEPPPATSETTERADQPQTPSTQSAENISPLMRDVLDIHNAARAAYGIAPIQIDPVLVAHAQTRAVELSQIGRLVHASREGRGTERENIVQGLIGESARQMMSRWESEKKHFKPGVFPDVCDNGGADECMGVWHWTQMIWEQSTHIGCGAAIGGGSAWLVCRYNPGGNKDGKPVGMGSQIAANTEIRPRLIGGDYGGPTIPNSASSQISLNHDYGYDAGLFVATTSARSGSRRRILTSRLTQTTSFGREASVSSPTSPRTRGLS